MTISEMIRAIGVLNRTQAIEKAKGLLKEYSVTAKELTEELTQMGRPINLLEFASQMLAVAIIADGGLSDSEYSMYVELCDAMGAEPLSFPQCRVLSFRPTQVVECYSEAVTAMKDYFIASNRRESFDKLALAIAALVFEDGDVALYETCFLDFFADPDTPTPTSATRSVDLNSQTSEPVVLLNHNASFSRYNNSYYISFGAELKNPNVDKCAHNVWVNVMVKDSSGRIIASRKDKADYIDSNAIFYYGDEFEIERGVPATYVVQVNCDDFVNAPKNSTFAQGITCSHFSLDYDSLFEQTVLSGNVRNGYRNSVYNSLFFVFYDAAGKITGGACDYYRTLYGNSEDGFEVRLHTEANRKSVKYSPSFDFTDVVD